MPFPLVLLDAQMPDMDGFALAARIQQDPTLAGATILMLSSADLPEATSRCRELGITGNGMKLSSNRLLDQLTAQFVSWLAHEGQLFRPPLLHTRFHAMGTCRIHQQGR